MNEGALYSWSHRNSEVVPTLLLNNTYTLRQGRALGPKVQKERNLRKTVSVNPGAHFLLGNSPSLLTYKIDDKGS